MSEEQSLQILNAIVEEINEQCVDLCKIIRPFKIDRQYGTLYMTANFFHQPLAITPKEIEKAENVKQLVFAKLIYANIETVEFIAIVNGRLNKHYPKE